MTDSDGGGQAGFDPTGFDRDLERMSASLRRFSSDARAEFEGLKDEQSGLQLSTRRLSSSFSRAFENAAIKGRSLGDVFRRLALDLSALTLDAALKPLSDALASGFANGFGALTQSAKGNVIAAGRVQPFAKGGVVNSPLLFPLRNGTGLAGEAGPEAILPLKRGADGRLGVAGGGGRPVSITFNVTTPDAESFRRSERQIAARLQRFARSGLGNL